MTYFTVSRQNEAKKLFQEICKFLATSSFNLTKWNSNCQHVFRLLNPDNQLKTKTAAPNIQKLLILSWFPETDRDVIKKTVPLD